MTPPRHLLEIDDLSAEEIGLVLDLAERADRPQLLAGRAVALLFEKPSLRTRNATEVAVVELGGHPLSLRGEEVGIGTREPAADIARVLSRYHAAICARVFEHHKLAELAAASSVPVVNLLSDDAHPCQALADLLTIRQHFGKVEGVEIAYVGDYNNVARSLGLAAALAGAGVRFGCPPGFGPPEADLDRLRAAGAEPMATSRPAEAATGANVLYGDVWASMGQEAEAEARRRAFDGFTVDTALLDAAAAGAVYLHCLPAHRGEEVTAEVVDGSRSLVWQQAENRLHATRGLFRFLLGPA